jgi:O-antigen/teichoic acid export membrane protein
MRPEWTTPPAKAVSKGSLLMSETLNRRGASATAIRSLGVEVPIGRWMLWAKKAGLAVLDQGLFTGSHFIINVLLARWLEPAQYGAFAVSYSVFMILGAIHTALLAEPMMVYGSGRYAATFHRYVAVLIYGHWAITSLIAVVLALWAWIAWSLGSAAMAQGLVGLTVASPCILLLWLVRRGFYVSSNPQWASIGSGLYLLVTVAGTYKLYQHGWLTVASAFLVMGASGLIVSMGFIGFLRPQWKLAARDRAGMATIFRDHWRYGRWAASTEVLYSLSVAMYYIVVVSILGLGGAAALKAMQNLVAPVHQFFGALALLLVPRSARRTRDASPTMLTRDALNISFALGLPAVVYCFLIVFLSSPIVHVLYAGKYVEQTILIPFIAMASVFAGIGAGPQVLLRARERADLVSVIALFLACVSLISSIVLVLRFGILGAAMGLSVSALSGACAAWWLWMKRGSKVCHQRS